MQQGVGGVGGSQPHYGAEDMSAAAGPSSSSMAGGEAGDQAQLVEAASPISSRPPASSSVNIDELMTLSGAAAAAEDALAAASDRAGSGSSSGNRWPRQETLALLKIRSEMDVAFRDATLKGPLWEDVSRKLAELGYKRSAKKCKEKFENVHKYYKRTKEGRAGRQDGKSYKFFSELEALHGTTSAAAAATPPNVSSSPPVHVTHASSPNPVSVGFGSISNPMPISSFRMSPTIPVIPSLQQPPLPPPASTTIPIIPSSSSQPIATPMDVNFSSNSSSSSQGSGSDDEDDDMEGEPSSRKRKRGSASASTSSSGSTRKMMEFFEILMKQVMQKQESMQKRFLEVIEKREQDRTIREEAWKRQEMARLTREHELMSQERAISASRDAAIIAFLQKITGQTIQLPPPVNVHTAPPPPVPPSVPVNTPLAPQPPQQQPPTQTYHQTPQQQQPQQQQVQHARRPQQSQIVVAVPEQQVPPSQENISSGGGGGGSFEPASSSRWPKAEVLALIKLRSGLESKYQEAGPKGPLWEEISAGMGRMGYKRSSKRCKEKWENINKYFKKVKESNKKRPEDAKTCPYFHELDALYRKRILGGSGGGSSSSLGHQNRLEQVQQQQPQPGDPKLDSVAQSSVPLVSQEAVVPTNQSENKNGDNRTNVGSSSMGLSTNLFGEATEEAAKKPEDIVKELMEQHSHHQQQILQQGQVQQLVVDDYGRIEEADSDNIMDQEDEDMEDEDIDEEDDEEMEEERKMDYKIEFQKQNTGPSSNGGGNGAPSFLAMVQ